MKKTTTGSELAALLGVSDSRGMEAVLKAKLLVAVAREIARSHLTHAN